MINDFEDDELPYDDFGDDIPTDEPVEEERQDDDIRFDDYSQYEDDLDADFEPEEGLSPEDLPCEACHGTGKLAGGACTECEGKGY